MKIQQIIEKVLSEETTEGRTGFAVLMLGGSIGSTVIRNASDAKGDECHSEIYDSVDKAKDKMKRMNSILSPGEKKHYGMKYIVVPVRDGKFI